MLLGCITRHKVICALYDHMTTWQLNTSLYCQWKSHQSRNRLPAAARERKKKRKKEINKSFTHHAMILGTKSSVFFLLLFLFQCSWATRSRGVRKTERISEQARTWFAISWSDFLSVLFKACTALQHVVCLCIVRNEGRKPPDFSCLGFTEDLAAGQLCSSPHQNITKYARSQVSVLCDLIDSV